MNQYQEMKMRHQKEVNEFPFGYAFSDQQFAEMMEKWGLDPETDIDKIATIGGGCFVRRQDLDAMHAMFDRHHVEREAAKNADKTGRGFIRDMFITEMNNHEYSYTGDAEETLDALGLTAGEVAEDKRLSRGFLQAHREVMNA